MSLDEQWDTSDRSGLVGKVAAQRYLIVAELSSDRRWSVYEAEDVEQEGTRVSLAVLPAGTATNDGAPLRSLRHPNLAAVLDTGTLESGERFLTMEVMRGTSLRTLIRRGHLDQRRALSIIREVLQALAAVHAVGAIHGDVVPESIIVTTDARGDEHATLLGVAMLSGDPRYSAPEGRGDARTDLYSVGAVLFELLTDRPPFFGDDASALQRMHTYAPIQTLKQRAPDRGFAAEQEELVARALAKKPDERFRAADEMLVALDAAMTATEALRTAALAARPPPLAVDESLALLTKGLLAVAPPSHDPVIPSNASRYVRALPWPSRVLALLRRTRAKVIVGGAIVLAVVIGFAVHRHGGGVTAAAVVEPPRDRAIARDASSAAPAPDARPDDATTYLALGHAQIGRGRPSDGLAAYQHAVQLTPELANDPELIASLVHVLTARDPATALPALDLLATSDRPAARDAIVAETTSPYATIRHRAVAIAEHEGIADRIDRVASWTLDLRAATTCPQRRTIIAKLAGTHDARALPELRRARTHTCGGREATAAIQRIKAHSR